MEMFGTSNICNPGIDSLLALVHVRPNKIEHSDPNVSYFESEQVQSPSPGRNFPFELEVELDIFVLSTLLWLSAQLTAHAILPPGGKVVFRQMAKQSISSNGRFSPKPVQQSPSKFARQP